jgi:hypothetical protein
VRVRSPGPQPRSAARRTAVRGAPQVVEWLGALALQRASGRVPLRRRHVASVASIADTLPERREHLVTAISATANRAAPGRARQGCAARGRRRPQEAPAAPAARSETDPVRGVGDPESPGVAAISGKTARAKPTAPGRAPSGRKALATARRAAPRRDGQARAAVRDAIGRRSPLRTSSGAGAASGRRAFGENE